MNTPVLHSTSFAVPRPHGAYRPDIDGLRAIAVLAVVVFHLHAAALPGGYLGVDVFFAISGYVVTGSLLGQTGRTFWPFIGEFYARRFARILPALCVTLLATALAATLLIPQSWLSGLSDRTGLYAFWGLSNWVMQSNADTYFAPRAEFNPYTHTWSLGVEEQFYLLAPLLIYLFMRWGRRSSAGRSVALGAALLLCLASVTAFVWQSNRRPDVAFYFIGCRFWELGVGVALRLWHEGLARRDEPGRALAASAWVGLAGLVVALVAARPGAMTWVWNLAAVVGTVLMLHAGREPRPRSLARGLGGAGPVWVGKRSYSIYLWHWPVVVLLRWTVGLESVVALALGGVLTLLLALVSYRWLELPLRHHRRIEAWPIWSRIAFFALFPLLGFAASHALFEHRSRLSWSDVARHSVDWYAGHRMPYEDPAQRPCQVVMQSSGWAGGVEHRYAPSACQGVAAERTLFVLGDSHAGAYLPMFEQLSADTGMTIRVFTFPSCPFLDLMQPQGLGRDPGCLAFSREVVGVLAQQAHARDLVFMPSLRLPRYGDQWASFKIPDMLARISDEPARQARAQALEDARGWLAPLAQQGLHLIFEAPKPIFRAPTFRCADWFNRHNPICEGDHQQPRAALEALRAPVLSGMTQLAREFPQVDVWDPLPVLCPGEVCTSLSQGRPLFFDGDHPSAYGNWVLYPDFKRQILAVIDSRG